MFEIKLKNSQDQSRFLFFNIISRLIRIITVVRLFSTCRSCSWTCWIGYNLHMNHINTLDTELIYCKPSTKCAVLLKWHRAFKRLDFIQKLNGWNHNIFAFYVYLVASYIYNNNNNIINKTIYIVPWSLRSMIQKLEHLCNMLLWHGQRMEH